MKSLLVSPLLLLLLVACVGDSPTPNPSNDAGTSDTSTQNDGSPSCAAPKTSCTKGSNTVCTDTSSDDANCGQCNDVCPTGSTCKTSSCTCTDGTKTFCKGGAGACVDLKTDPKNCGTCGFACPNANCTNGVCDKVVFVTKAGYGTAFGGFAAADKICTDAAKAAGLPGTAYKAWVSAGNVGPGATFTTLSTVPYVLPDGTQVAANFAGLNGTLKHAIDQTELKAPVGANTFVMTNANPDGTLYSSSNDCGNWNLDSTPYKFAYGSANVTTTQWSVSSAVFDCTTALTYHFYCFQQ